MSSDSYSRSSKRRISPAVTISDDEEDPNELLEIKPPQPKFRRHDEYNDRSAYYSDRRDRHRKYGSYKHDYYPSSSSSSYYKHSSYPNRYESGKRYYQYDSDTKSRSYEYDEYERKKRHSHHRDRRDDRRSDKYRDDRYEEEEEQAFRDELKRKEEEQRSKEEKKKHRGKEHSHKKEKKHKEREKEKEKEDQERSSEERTRKKDHHSSKNDKTPPASYDLEKRLKSAVVVVSDDSPVSPPVLRDSGSEEVLSITPGSIRSLSSMYAESDGGVQKMEETKPVEEEQEEEEEGEIGENRRAKESEEVSTSGDDEQEEEEEEEDNDEEEVEQGSSSDGIEQEEESGEEDEDDDDDEEAEEEGEEEDSSDEEEEDEEEDEDESDEDEKQLEKKLKSSKPAEPKLQKTEVKADTKNRAESSQQGSAGKVASVKKEQDIAGPSTSRPKATKQVKYKMYYPALQGCRSVEQFHCLNKIEEGTYGVVYRARDKRTNEIVALKRLKMEKEKEGFPITSLREINTLLKAQHPNIVTVREIVVGSNMDKIFIVMDYVEHDLKSLMETMKEKKSSFITSEVKCLMLQLLGAVAHLHDNWILHRDLKTSNLLFSHQGILKVGDFGLAREYGSPLKHYTSVVVTLWYRAPELLLGTKLYSTPIDMWSIGCIFAELLCMKALFPGKSEIDQINLIFKTLGTPTEKQWPDCKKLPMMQKINFHQYPAGGLRSKVPHHVLNETGLDLLNKFLTYNPKERISAEKAMRHPFFAEHPLAIEPDMFPTWPAKSEPGSHLKLKGDSPKAPSGGQGYKDLGEDEGFYIGVGERGNPLGIPRNTSYDSTFCLKF